MDMANRLEIRIGNTDMANRLEVYDEEGKLIVWYMDNNQRNIDKYMSGLKAVNNKLKFKIVENVG